MESADQFDSFDDRVWLNCAHQGPLPVRAVAAAQQALADKANPVRIRDEAFFEVPQRLRATLAQLVGAMPDEIALGNSTSYGLSVVINNFPWQDGDQVLLVDGDFPADIYPWLPLGRRGVEVTLIEPRGDRLYVGDVERALTPATRFFCTTWVNSFSGYAIDIDRIGALCRECGVLFVLNGSQAVGAREIDVASTPIDMLTCCGFKWLCGPYATGFVWLSPRLLDKLDRMQAYWLTHMPQTDLSGELNYRLRDDLGAEAYDVLCPANFINFSAWQASLDLILEIGVAEIAAHDRVLIERLTQGLPDDFKLISPANDDPAQSTLIVISDRQHGQNEGIAASLSQSGVDIAVREGNLRLSPHFYNDVEDIDRALRSLTDAAAPAVVKYR